MPDEEAWDHSDDEDGYPWDCDLGGSLANEEEQDEDND